MNLNAYKRMLLAYHENDLIAARRSALDILEETGLTACQMHDVIGLIYRTEKTISDGAF